MAEKIISLGVIDSTNTYGKQNFDALADGTLIVASGQTSGRGRLGRVWESPEGVNFYGSAIFKQCADGFSATAVLSLAALDTIAELAPELSPYIKWPNDIYIGVNKLGGMLCEGILDNHNKFQGIVAGLGLNLNMDSASLYAIGQPATSLYHETNQQFSSIFFTKKLAFFLNMRYIMYQKYASLIFDEWKSANKLIGRPLKVCGFSGEMVGVFRDISPTGEMLLETEAGVISVSSGDVQIDKNSIKCEA